MVVVLEGWSTEYSLYFNVKYSPSPLSFQKLVLKDAMTYHWVERTEELSVNVGSQVLVQSARMLYILGRVLFWGMFTQCCCIKAVSFFVLVPRIKSRAVRMRGKYPIIELNHHPSEFKAYVRNQRWHLKVWPCLVIQFKDIVSFLSLIFISKNYIL